jgi:tetratricopeptide (TPR) repeat protein
LPPVGRLLLADGVIDLDLGEIHRKDRLERLTPNERELLVYLAARAGRDISREELHQRVWGHAVRVVSRAVTLTVHRLRRKIEQDPDQPVHLATGQGGYRWVPLRSGVAAPTARVVLLIAEPTSPGEAPWLTACADLARDGGLYLVELAPDRVVLATDEPPRAVSAASALAELASVRLGMAVGEAECLVDPVSGRTLYGGALLERAAFLARTARPGQVPQSPAEVGQREVVRAGTPQPVRLDRFLGRARELEELLQQIQGGGPLLLVGPAGVGKTRLAEELVIRLEREGLVVALRPDNTLAEALQAVVHALGLSQVPDPVGAVGDALAVRGPGVLVLDGADAVASELGPALARFRSSAPETWLVLTSRERPELEGAVVVELGGLSVADGVALLRDRCPTLPEGAPLGPLVEQLDGLPLALELVAPRLRILAPDELESMQGRLMDVLVRRSGEPRHRSMRRALEQSWERLDEHERSLLARASVFAGPFTLEDANAVLSTEAPGAPWFVDTLQSLCERYLVQVESVGGRSRFRLLSTVRAFAAEHRGLWGDAEHRHARYFGERGGDLRPLGPPFGPEVLPELERAVRAATAQGWSELAVSAVHAHAQGSLFYGGPDPSLVLVEEVLRLPLGPALRARLGYARAQLLRRAGRAEQGLLVLREALAEELVEPAILGRLEMQSGLTLASLRRYPEARDAYGRAEAWFLQAHHEVGLAALRLNVAALHHASGSRAEGLQVLEPLLDSEDPNLRACAMGITGALHAAMGELTLAVRWLTQAVPALEGLGEHAQASNFRLLLGETLAAQGQLAEAADAYRSSLEPLQRLGSSAWVLVTHVKLAALELGREQPDAARLWMEQAQPWAQRCGDPRPRGMYQAVLCEVLARGGDEPGSQAAAQQARVLLEGCADRESLAHLAVHRGMAALALGEPAAGVRDELALAERGAAELGARPHSGLAREMRRLRRALHAHSPTETD